MRTIFYSKAFEMLLKNILFNLKTRIITYASQEITILCQFCIRIILHVTIIEWKNMLCTPYSIEMLL